MAEIPASKLSRRAFTKRIVLGLGAILGLSGLLAAPAFSRLQAIAREKLGRQWIRWRYRSTPIGEAIVSYFDYLTIPPETVQAFVTEYEATYRDARTARIDEALEVFLLSTDFFPNGANESKPLRYLALFAPDVHPCFNPLANLGP